MLTNTVELLVVRTTGNRLSSAYMARHKTPIPKFKPVTQALNPKLKPRAVIGYREVSGFGLQPNFVPKSQCNH